MNIPQNAGVNQRFFFRYFLRHDGIGDDFLFAAGGDFFWVAIFFFVSKNISLNHSIYVGLSIYMDIYI